MDTYHQLDNNKQTYLNQMSFTVQKFWFKCIKRDIVWKMATILFLHKCVKWLLFDLDYHLINLTRTILSSWDKCSESYHIWFSRWWAKCRRSYFDSQVKWGMHIKFHLRATQFIFFVTSLDNCFDLYCRCSIFITKEGFGWYRFNVITLVTPGKSGAFFQLVILFSDVVHYKCDISV